MHAIQDTIARPARWYGREQKLPRAVCGGETRMRLEHPGIDKYGLVLDQIYAGKASGAERQHLTDLYMQLIDADCMISNLGLSDINPLPDREHVFFKRLYQSIKELALTVEALAIANRIVPPEALVVAEIH